MSRLSHVVLMTLVTLYLVTGEGQVKKPRYVIKNNEKLRKTFNKLIQDVSNVNQERLDALKKLYDLQNYRPKVSWNEDQDVTAHNHKKDVIQRSRINQLYNDRHNMEPEDTLEILKQIIRMIIRNSAHEENVRPRSLTIDISDFYNNSPKTNSRSVHKGSENGKIKTGDIKDRNAIYIRSEDYTNDYKKSQFEERKEKLKNISDVYLAILKNRNLMTLVSDIKESNNKIEFEHLRIQRSSCSRKRKRKYCIRACRNAVREICSEYNCRTSMKKRFRKLCKSECRLQFT